MVVQESPSYSEKLPGPERWSLSLC